MSATPDFFFPNEINFSAMHDVCKISDENIQMQTITGLNSIKFLNDFVFEHQASQQCSYHRIAVLETSSSHNSHLLK